jgi:alpha-D-ribose 1-methylphosphonate 5-triphosphate synthase subunit PhnH
LYSNRLISHILLSQIFKEIGAIEPLKRAASSPNALASKFAAQALLVIGEDVPYKLSQQVPLWSEEDVQHWLRRVRKHI